MVMKQHSVQTQLHMSSHQIENMGPHKTPFQLSMLHPLDEFQGPQNFMVKVLAIV